MPASVSETESFTTAVTGPAGGDPRTAASVRNMGVPLASRSLWLRRRLEDLIGAFKVIDSVDPTTDLITSVGHGFVLNDPVRLTTVGGTIPGGLSAGVVYYARDIGADTFGLAASAGGALVNVTSAGSGALYAWPVVDGLGALFAPASSPSGIALPAGSIRSQIAALASSMAVIVTNLLAAANVWTGSNAFNSSVALNAAISLGGSSFLQRFGKASERDGVDLSDADQTIDTSMGDTFFCAQPAANRVITIRQTTLPTHISGEEITIVRPAAGAFTIQIWKEGGAAPMVTLDASTWAAARFVFKASTNWKLKMRSPGVTVGAEA